MNKIYKYHYILYLLYKTFGREVFTSGEAKEELRDMLMAGLNPAWISFGKLRDKGLIEHNLRKNDIDLDIDKPYDHRYNYQKISEKGLKIVKEIEDDKKLITKFLMRSM